MTSDPPDQGAAIPSDGASPVAQTSPSPSSEISTPSITGKEIGISPPNSSPRWAKLRFHHLGQGLQRWPWVLPLLLSMGTAAIAFGWILRLPPATSCKDLSLIASDSEKLYCADQSARQGNLEALLKALELTSNWPKNHPLSAQAQRLTEEWSTAILVIARQKLNQGDLQAAVELARKVPKSTNAYTEAQGLVTSWQEDGDQGKDIYKQAQASMQNQDWQGAIDHAKSLAQLGSQYWQSSARKLMEQIAVERQAWNQFQLAEDAADRNSADGLSRAIELASQLNSKTYAYTKAKQALEGWSQALLTIAQARQQAGDLAGAIALVEKIAPGSSAAKNAQDLALMGQAQAAARQGTFFSYLKAVAMAQQIPVNTPLGARATAQISEWEKQLQNLTQLSLAQGLASSHQRWGYQLAIDQAAVIDAKQPSHRKATTLSQNWQEQVARSEDKPLLIAASSLAADNQLEAAIQTAGQITAQRPLYTEAQQQIRQWRTDVERVTDQPLLDQAKSLANQGDLTGAIATAAEIKPGRILYQEAQDLIGTWLDERDARSRPQPKPPEPTESPSLEPETPEPSPEFTPIAPASSSPETVSPEPPPSPTAAPEPPPSPEVVSPEPPPTTPEPGVTPAFP